MCDVFTCIARAPGSYHCPAGCPPVEPTEPCRHEQEQIAEEIGRRPPKTECDGECIDCDIEPEHQPPGCDL